MSSSLSAGTSSNPSSNTNRPPASSAARPNFGGKPILRSSSSINRRQIQRGVAQAAEFQQHRHQVKPITRCGGFRKFLAGRFKPAAPQRHQADVTQECRLASSRCTEQTSETGVCSSLATSRPDLGLFAIGGHEKRSPPSVNERFLELVQGPVTAQKVQAERCGLRCRSSPARPAQPLPRILIPVISYAHSSTDTGNKQPQPVYPKYPRTGRGVAICTSTRSTRVFADFTCIRRVFQ